MNNLQWAIILIIAVVISFVAGRFYQLVKIQRDIKKWDCNKPKSAGG